MDRASFFLLLIVIVSSLLSIGFSYSRFFGFRNYILYADVSCTTSKEQCFMGDGENQPVFYKKIIKIAKDVPVCDGWMGECKELTCTPLDSFCEVIYCDPEEELCSAI